MDFDDLKFQWFLSPPKSTPKEQAYTAFWTILSEFQQSEIPTKNVYNFGPGLFSCRWFQTRIWSSRFSLSFISGSQMLNLVKDMKEAGVSEAGFLNAKVAP